ncbi:MAG: nucleotidyltransferase family protein [Bacilli bacterium]|nr:nucleotidyltransferase family protein [Bacilli bacterium]MBN2877456.1 nucleotidyltransferase family protein [Bacilli bacterium]
MDGIVLAAGYSSRAKTNKMMLIYKGKPLIDHAITLLRTFCERVIVVTGHFHTEIANHLKEIPEVLLVYNPNYSNGMFSSILAGVRETKSDFLILPGDVPTILPSTIERLLSGSLEIRVPSTNHHLGHPIYFNHKYKTELLKTNHPNLKAFRNDHSFEIIEVDDPGILLDIDHMDDYHTLIGKE